VEIGKFPRNHKNSKADPVWHRKKWATL